MYYNNLEKTPHLLPVVQSAAICLYLKLRYSMVFLIHIDYHTIKNMDIDWSPSPFQH